MSRSCPTWPQQDGYFGSLFSGPFLWQWTLAADSGLKSLLDPRGSELSNSCSVTADYFQVLCTINVLCHNLDRVDESFSMYFPSHPPFNLVSHFNKYAVVGFQSIGRVRLFATPWTACSMSGGFPVLHHLPELAQTHVH